LPERTIDEIESGVLPARVRRNALHISDDRCGACGDCGEGDASAADFLEDLIAGGCPDERFGVVRAFDRV
jgi:hypothetical protein